MESLFIVSSDKIIELWSDFDFGIEGCWGLSVGGHFLTLGGKHGTGFLSVHLL